MSWHEMLGRWYLTSLIQSLWGHRTMGTIKRCSHPYIHMYVPPTTSTESCPSDQWGCTSGRQCVDRDVLCDGQAQCWDGSDETDGCTGQFVLSCLPTYSGVSNSRVDTLIHVITCFQETRLLVSACLSYYDSYNSLMNTCVAWLWKKR